MATGYYIGIMSEQGLEELVRLSDFIEQMK